MVFRKGAVEIGDQAHPELEQLPHLGFDLLPVRMQLARAVFGLVKLPPGGERNHPCVDERLRGKDHHLQASQEVFDRCALAHFGRPEQPAEPGTYHASEKVGLIVEVAVEHEWQRRGEGVSGSDLAEGAEVVFAEGLPEGPGIEGAEQGMHLLAIHAAGEFGVLGK